MGSILILLLLILPGCQAPAWEDDPDVQTARIACAGLRKTEHYDCVEERAVARLNPNICRLALAGLDEFCLRTLYEAAEDAAICDQMYLAQVEESCRAWYAERSP